MRKSSMKILLVSLLTLSLVACGEKSTSTSEESQRMGAKSQKSTPAQEQSREPLGGASMSETPPAKTLTTMEGISFQKLSKKAETRDAGETLVRDFFWYGCGHCGTAAPGLSKTFDEMKASGERLRVEKNPVPANPTWEVGARFYFAMAAQNMSEEIHLEVFKAVSTGEIDPRKKESFVAWAVKKGFSAEKINEDWASFSTDSKIRNAKLMSIRYGVEGTPSIGLNGDVLITAAEVQGGSQNLGETTRRLSVLLK